MQLLLRVAVSVHPQRALLVDLALPAEEEDIADGTLKATEICWRGQTHVFPAACEGPTFFCCCEVRSIYCQDISKSIIIQHIIFTFLIQLAIKIDIR